MTLVLLKAATCRSNTAGRREITTGSLHLPLISSAGRLQLSLRSAVMLLRLQPRPQPPPYPSSLPSQRIQSAAGWSPACIDPVAISPASAVF